MGRKSIQELKKLLSLFYNFLIFGRFQGALNSKPMLRTSSEISVIAGLILMVDQIQVRPIIKDYRVII